MIKIMRSFSASFFLLFTKELYSFSFVWLTITSSVCILSLLIKGVLTAFSSA
jgi:hypothetical protein